MYFLGVRGLTLSYVVYVCTTSGHTDLSSIELFIHTYSMGQSPS